MPLLIVEGPRKSGKSYLISQQTTLPVFKFPFNENFLLWGFPKQTQDIHWFGLGKEVMLHELDIDGHLPKLLVDRGILTNTVWGIFQKRIDEHQARQDLHNFSKRGLFKHTQFLLIEGELKETRKKDIWDEDDKRREEEKALFLMFSDLLRDLGVKVHTFTNNFDLDSVIRFKMKINKF